MKASRILPLLVGLAIAGVAGASSPTSAPTLVETALHTAKAEHKGVLVIFHASWCGWCKQLDKSFEVPAMKAVLDKDFVILHVTVMEDPAHKADENPGGGDMMIKFGGQDAGLPFFVALGAQGQVVADSKVVSPGNPKPQNMGFPTEPNEIDHFIAMLKASNPRLNAADAAAVHQVLVDRAAEIKAAHH